MLSGAVGDVAALTRSSLICWENYTPNNKTMDPSPENNRAAWYQGPMKIEVVKSCGATRCGHAPNMCAFLVTRAFSAFKRAVGDFTVWHDQMAFTYLIFRRCQTFVFLQSKTAIQTTRSIFIVSRVKILQVFWGILAAFLRGFSASHLKPGAGFMKPSSAKICPMYC